MQILLITNTVLPPYIMLCGHGMSESMLVWEHNIMQQQITSLFGFYWAVLNGSLLLFHSALFSMYVLNLLFTSKC